MLVVITPLKSIYQELPFTIKEARFDRSFINEIVFFPFEPIPRVTAVLGIKFSSAVGLSIYVVH